jgi:hypothetical protein
MSVAINMVENRVSFMRFKWSVAATVCAFSVAYLCYPYIALYRLGEAIHGADAATLESMVDWPSVREGIKEDICDLVVDDPNSSVPAQLPPFGASFVRGIASSTIDQKVTPQAIVAAAVAVPDTRPATAPHGADVHVIWAFFDSPTRFTVSLRTTGVAEPIRLEMELRHGDWQVQRVWLPAELLGNPPART